MKHDKSVPNRMISRKPVPRKMVRRARIPILPTGGRGCKSKSQKLENERSLAKFANVILEIASTLYYKISSRGWAYILEGKNLITKGEFNIAANLINTCRKNGLLPVDICAKDETRSVLDVFDYVDKEMDIEWEVEQLLDFDGKIDDLVDMYNPLHPIDFQDCYVEIVVEKIDLVGLFEPLCRKYHVPISNFKGWTDLNSRVDLIHRFNKWHEKGKRCIILYCGDHDPGGLQITKFLPKNLQDMELAAGCSSDYIEVDRFGLNYDFIEDNNLMWINNLITSSGQDPTIPKRDKKGKITRAVEHHVVSYVEKFGKRKCEANALIVQPEAGLRLCEEAILNYVNVDGIAEYESELERIREETKKALTDELNHRL